MNIRLTFLLCLAVLLVSSCTKELSVEQDDDPPVTDTTGTNGNTDTIPLAENGGLLKRWVSRYEGEEDSMVISFMYDGNNKVMEIRGVNEGIATEGDNLYSFMERFWRNEKGQVDKMKLETYLYYSGPSDPQLHWSENFDLHYDADSEYQYALATGTGESDPINDSIAYTYGGHGFISTVAIYHLKVNDTAHLGDKFEYEYNTGGNITTRKATAVRNYPNREVWFIDRFDYDDQINPINFGQEMLLAGDFMISMPTTNNVTACSDAINPENGYTVQYIYNSYNKPVSATWHYNSGEKMTVRYYYLKG